MGDFADGYALRALMESSGGGGGDEPQNLKWERPAEWPQMPEPAENEACFLLFINGEKYPDGVVVQIITNRDNGVQHMISTVDWGDGGADTEEEYTNPHISFEHTYFTDEISYFVIKVTCNYTYNQSRQITFRYACHNEDVKYGGVLEMYVGKNVLVGCSSGFRYTTQHIKFYNSPTSTSSEINSINYFFNEMVRSCQEVICIETFEPWKYIPNSFANNNYNLSFFDFSKVKEIGTSAFCSYAFFDVSLPECEKIGNGSFNHAYSLKSFSAPKITALNDICTYSAYGLQKLNLENLKEMSSCFNNCYSLKQINMPDCSSIKNSFSYSYSLLKLNVPKCETISSSFTYAGGLDPGNVILSENVVLDSTVFSENYYLRNFYNLD